ncbi:MAG: hypothetical protein ACI4DY_13265 [Monoglobaceae bacterium]
MARTRKMRAQLRYHKREDGREGYAINILTDDGWSLESWYPLVAKVGADKVGAENETDYIHWSILRKLANMQDYGYEIDLDF